MDRSAASHQGIVMELHSVWRVVALNVVTIRLIIFSIDFDPIFEKKNSISTFKLIFL